MNSKFDRFHFVDIALKLVEPSTQDGIYFNIIIRSESSWIKWKNIFYK